MAGSSWAAVEVAVNRSRIQGEGVGGSLAGPLRRRHWAVAGVEEGGYPLQVEVEGSCCWAAVAWEWQALGNSWQPKEVEEEGSQGLEVEEEGSHPVMEVEVGHFQSPAKTEYYIMTQHVKEGGTFLQLFFTKTDSSVLSCESLK